MFDTLVPSIVESESKRGFYFIMISAQDETGELQFVEKINFDASNYPVKDREKVVREFAADYLDNNRARLSALVSPSLDSGMAVCWRPISKDAIVVLPLILPVYCNGGVPTDDNTGWQAFDEESYIAGLEWLAA